MPAPLPTPNPYNATAEAASRAAYDRCLDLESRHDQVPRYGRLDVLICARMLGYMLLKAPTEQGRTDIALKILCCPLQDDAGLQFLAELYKNHFFRFFYSIKGRTPTPSLHPSAPSFEAERDCYSNALERPPLSHATSKKYALERDQYRCLITGKVDIPSVVGGFTTLPSSTPSTYTHAAHIFDRLTNENLEDNNKAEYAASASALLDQYGQIDILDELNGKNFHRLENILTLSTDMHTSFDGLKIWLERNQDDPPDTYRPASIEPRVFLQNVPPIIEFTTTDSERLPLPNPRYLALHAACAQVAHMSGVGEYMETAILEMEEAKVLASNGNSDVLYHALIRRRDVRIY